MISEDSPAEAYRRVLDQAGCSFARDSYDRDVIRQVRLGLGENGSNGIIDTPSQVGGWPQLRSAAPATDTDGDGMPDAWETARGLDPRDPADATARTLDPGGYTNIEIYLNSLLR